MLDKICEKRQFGTNGWAKCQTRNLGFWFNSMFTLNPRNCRPPASPHQAAEVYSALHMTSPSEDPLICIISFWQGHNSAYIFEDRGKRTCSPFFVPVELEQTCNRAVEGLPLFRADMNQTWNGLDKVIVILIPGGVRPTDSAERGGKAERLHFSVKSWGNVSIWCMNNLDGSSWFLLLLCLRSAFSLGSAPPAVTPPSLTSLLRLVCDA